MLILDTEVDMKGEWYRIEIKPSPATISDTYSDTVLLFHNRFSPLSSRSLNGYGPLSIEPTMSINYMRNITYDNPLLNMPDIIPRLYVTRGISTVNMILEPVDFAAKIAMPVDDTLWQQYVRTGASKYESRELIR